MLNNATNEVGNYNDIANMFILICLRNNFCFLVGDPDVGTVAPDLIIIHAGQNDDYRRVFFQWYPPKKLKYEKPRLGVSRPG